MKYLVLLFLIFTSCSQKEKRDIIAKPDKIKLSESDSIKLVSYVEEAFKLGLHSIERQHYLDSALQIKPDASYLWQQKAMPLYKARKYSVGKPFLAKAVAYDPQKYLDYSAFMKCIFSKEYKESIEEFLKVKETYGDSYVMDHTYNFYIGLDYLQLNEFEKAKEFLLKSMAQQLNDFPDDTPEEACHYLDWYYIGIAHYELKNYEEAIRCFDTSLKVYVDFADALYFKATCLKKQGKEEEAGKIMTKAFDRVENTINEDNVFYEVYPYQVFHKLSPWSKPKK